MFFIRYSLSCSCKIIIPFDIVCVSVAVAPVDCGTMGTIVEDCVVVEVVLVAVETVDCVVVEVLSVVAGTLAAVKTKYLHDRHKCVTVIAFQTVQRYILMF